MMSLQEATMGEGREFESHDASSRWLMLRIIIAAIATLLLISAFAGFFNTFMQSSRPISVLAVAVMMGFCAAIGVLLFTQWRWIKIFRANGEPLNKREALNRNIMLLCCFIGTVIGLATAIVSRGNQKVGFMETLDGPLPTAIAVSVAVSWSVIMPIIAWVWHSRAIDEQEAAAYRDGGYYAAYTYMIAAPTWWVLWRGGLLPEPNGVAIFYMFMTVWFGVWAWKKYF